MGQVTIAGNDVLTFGTVAAADVYFKTALGGTGWTKASGGDRAKALVSATRWLTRLGVTDGTTALVPSLSDAGVPADVMLGAYELADALLVDVEQQAKQGTGSNVKAVGAGSTRVEFFRSTSDTAPPLPLVAWQLLSPYLPGQSGGVSGVGAEAFGTCEESRFGDEDAYGLSRPFS